MRVCACMRGACVYVRACVRACVCVCGGGGRGVSVCVCADVFYWSSFFLLHLLYFRICPKHGGDHSFGHLARNSICDVLIGRSCCGD